MTEILDVAELPAASYALTWRLIVPLFQGLELILKLYGATESVEDNVPFTNSSTLVTPTLSLAEAVRAKEPET